MDGCRRDYYSPCEQCGRCKDRLPDPEENEEQEEADGED